MIRNRCIDHLREKKRNHQVPIANQADFPESDTEEKIDATDLGSQIWLSIAKLPDRCRIAFEYSRIDELTYPQIANKMGISTKAIEALVTRALKALHANLVDLMCIIILLYL